MHVYIYLVKQHNIQLVYGNKVVLQSPTEVYQNKRCLIIELCTPLLRAH